MNDLFCEKKNQICFYYYYFYCYSATKHYVSLPYESIGYLGHLTEKCYVKFLWLKFFFLFFSPNYFYLGILNLRRLMDFIVGCICIVKLVYIVYYYLFCQYFSEVILLCAFCHAKYGVPHCLSLAEIHPCLLKGWKGLL